MQPVAAHQEREYGVTCAHGRAEDEQNGVEITQHKYIRLENGLACCLIQVANTCSVHLCISLPVGSMTDPPQLQGRAHLLEHVTMFTPPGVPSTPHTPCLKNLTAQHAGSCNAETGLVHTSYWFTVPEGAAQGAMECLVRALLQPVGKQALEASIDIIDAEFRRARCSSMRALRHVRKSLLTGSPFSQFTCGNAATLRVHPAAHNVDVLDAVAQLQREHYVASNACACIVGPDLGPLEVMARAALGQLPSSSAEHGAMQGGGAPAGMAVPMQHLLRCPQLPMPGPGLLVAVSSRSGVAPSLELFWCLPHEATRGAGSGGWRPWLMAGHLLGHEGHGSLAAAAKERGLITQLVVGVQDEVRGNLAREVGAGFMTWGVRLQLTAAGTAQGGALVVEVHRVLGQMARLDLDVRKRLAQELAEVCAAHAQGAARGPRQLACDVAHQMHYCQPEECMAGTAALLGTYDDVAFSQFMAHLSPARLIVTLAKPQAAGPHPCVEQWFGVPHTAGPLPQELFAACTAALGGGSVPITSFATGNTAGQVLGPALHLDEPLQVQLPPAPSWALPIDMTLKGPPHPQHPPAQPNLLEDAPELKLWHTLDTRFGPKAHVFIHLLNVAVSDSLSSYASSLLALAAVQAHTALEMACAAQLAASVRLACLQTGVTVHLQGFSSLMPRMLQLVLDAVVQLVSDEQLLRKRYDQVLRGEAARLQTWCTSTPAFHAQYAARNHLQPGSHHNLDVLALLHTQLQQPSSTQNGVQLTPASPEISAQLMHAALRSWQGAAVEMLAYGNVSAEDAQRLSTMVRTVLSPCHPTPDCTQPGPVQPAPSVRPAAAQALVAAAGTLCNQPMVLDARNPNPANTSSAMYYLLMGAPGSHSVDHEALMELLAAVIAQPAVTALRAEQRLGYAVSCGPAKLPQRATGLQIQVQSPHASAAEQRASSQAFLHGFASDLAGMPEERLTAVIAGLHSRLLARPKTLAAAAAKAWQPIKHKHYEYGRTEAIAAAVMRVELGQLVSFLGDVMQGPALCCQISPRVTHAAVGQQAGGRAGRAGQGRGQGMRGGRRAVAGRH